MASDLPVTERVCEERVNRVIAETKLLIQPLVLALGEVKDNQKASGETIKQLYDKFEKVKEEIGKAAIDAANGTITYKLNGKDKALVVATAITAIGGITVALITILPQIL